MSKNKILLIILLFIVLICINSIVYGKYVIEDVFTVAEINIDRNPPKIDMVSVSNVNMKYPFYANKTHTVTLQFRVTEKNIKENNFNTENIVAFIGDKILDYQNMKITKITAFDDYVYYSVALNNLEGNGMLKVNVKKGTIIDRSNNVNEEKVIDTLRTIDNISPEYSFEEIEQPEGKVIARIKTNEKIISINGWNLLEDKLTLEKEFPANTSYILKITDLAQNVSEVKIDITKASNVKISYASKNSKMEWSYGNENSNVAGKEAVLTNSKLKTETLAFRVEGSLDKDFVQFRSYIYTHWGENSLAQCKKFGTIYKYGFNPNANQANTMNVGNFITLNQQKYLQFGGEGINDYNATDINGNNPIPKEIADEYRYGISEIEIQLVNYNDYSILYQVLVDGIGWVKTASDGQKCCYTYTKPFSAIRVTLVPKTEKQYIIDLWNKDLGTYNIK